MRFQNTFTVDAPIDEVYAALLDVERVAPCVPGAQVLERTGDDAYTVAIKVKVGPMAMTYRGSVEIVDRDAQTHSARMHAKAKEARGQGTADAQVQMSLARAQDATQGTITADVQLSGKAAAMGQGVIQDVSARIVQTFSTNLAAMLGSGVEAPDGDPEPFGGPVGAGTGHTNGTSSGTGAAPADALPIGQIAGAVIAGRLRDPRVRAGLAGLIFLLGWWWISG